MVPNENWKNPRIPKKIQKVRILEKFSETISVKNWPKNEILIFFAHAIFVKFQN